MPAEQLSKYRIILASRSPRRIQLLKDTGLDFSIEVRDYDETYPRNLKGEEIALYLARHKADSFRKEIRENEIVITADTIVWCNGEVLGKPDNEDDAKRMIRILAGNTHEVITGVTLLTTRKEISFTDTTKVTFQEMTEEEINYYIDNFRPYDKAGAYGIQEWIGITSCSSIEGSYFNVVGLPVHRVYKELKALIKGT
ncbi:MAG: septum formation protein Maf [Bacteroidales bacterium]|nr:septum formation protein Maf [Bacteroidales bacterium]